MNQFEINAEKREIAGKSANRQLRSSGKIPGVVYGGGKAELMITIDHNEILQHLENEAFYSHILTLKIGKKTEKVVLKDLQRHPYKQSLLHFDLLRINEKESLTMRIPLHFINEEKSIGVKNSGGIISHIMTEVDIVCLPKDLPEYIEVDMLEVDINETLHLADLKLPAGVQLYSELHGGDNSLPVVSIYTAKGTTSDTDTAEEDEKEPETTS